MPLLGQVLGGKEEANWVCFLISKTAQRKEGSAWRAGAAAEWHPAAVAAAPERQRAEAAEAWLGHPTHQRARKFQRALPATAGSGELKHNTVMITVVILWWWGSRCGKPGSKHRLSALPPSCRNSCLFHAAPKLLAPVSLPSWRQPNCLLPASPSWDTGTAARMALCPLCSHAESSCRCKSWAGGTQRGGCCILACPARSRCAAARGRLAACRCRWILPPPLCCYFLSPQG